MARTIWLGIGHDTDEDGTLVFGLVMWADTIGECDDLIEECCGTVMARQVFDLGVAEEFTEEQFPKEKIAEALNESEGPVFYVALSDDRSWENNPAHLPNDPDLWKVEDADFLRKWGLD